MGNVCQSQVFLHTTSLQISMNVMWELTIVMVMLRAPMMMGVSCATATLDMKEMALTAQVCNYNVKGVYWYII